MDVFFALLYIFIVLSILVPFARQRMLENARYRQIRRLEVERGSRVITLIHRQEALSFLGIPFARFINIDDSERVLRAIRLTPDDCPIDLLLHTPGGLVLASEQIARALDNHPAKVTVFVPHYAMSGGTLIALASDEIVIDENAVLGPVDPQIGEFPAASIIAAVEVKSRDELDDRTLILADIAEKARRQLNDAIYRLIGDKMSEEQAREVAAVLSEGRWTHDYPLTVSEAHELGLPVRTGLPIAVYDLMDLYPQPTQRRPSVEYVPLPYRRRDGRKGPSDLI